MIHPRTLLGAYGLRAGKKRGQNFLTQPATAQAIVDSAGIGPEDTVVEIGAGLGALTLRLAARARRVLAVEVDRGLHQALLQVLAEGQAEQVRALLADALDLDWPALAAEAGGPLMVVGNLPYAISSPLLFRLVQNRAHIKGATLMLQRELAQRLAAGPGGKDYGRLTVLMQTWYEVRPGLEVGPEQFFPRPAVASRVVHLAPRPRPLVDFAGPAAEEWFSRVVKAAFGQRRKTLANSLAGGLGLARPQAAAALERAGIDPMRRAETLSIAEFAAAAAALGPGGPASGSV
ncbi:MAG: 16S rRNA (adenine(1518)-N(6)/adenine(1519)-N(6))-dimethyltransferase RsmA [Thermodesulfobacteriota bacterium]